MPQVSQPSNVLTMNFRLRLEPSSPFRVGKILIYDNTDYQKLHKTWGDEKKNVYLIIFLEWS